MSGPVSGRCSWRAVPQLSAVLRVTSEERGAEESRQPWGGEKFVTLERVSENNEESPCFLYLQCDPQGQEEILSLTVVSQARNMEVYVNDEEYVGTSRGEEFCLTVSDSGNSTVAFYMKFLKMDSPTSVCKVKLLSLGGKERILLREINVQLTVSSVQHPKHFPPLGARIDLGQVQTMMDCMGCKLSPGAQQLLSMVQHQQKQNPFPFGIQLQGLGCAWRGEYPMQRLKIPTDCVQPLQQPLAVPENRGSQTLNQQTSGSSNLPKADLLPLLQSHCGQEGSIQHNPETVTSEEHTVKAGNEQPVCAYLESIVSRSMEQVQKKLLTHIDDRMDRLREHLDAQFTLLTALLQNLHPSCLPQERLSRNETNFPNS
uniref:ATPase PAAT n=1 Tax=Geotrypetes seraphini TaxID=260995 RepID=A0A6P8REW9_GEOSA|nr:ATPase PAAT [Geotrypetes seraphini]